MEIVTGDQAPTLERTEAMRLLQEMAAVVRTIFAVDAAPQQEAQQELHPTTAGSGGVPGSGGAAPAPAVVPSVPATPVATPPVAPLASIPVPGVAMLQEIAFLDD
ncbi:hypothetical protein [Nocardioides sp. URHA0032]|uniref:hypothetical protein n=1 Tax=Nocardioides sp. URHA0032 TaxID=1380388 RepID=UPI00048D5E3F|nr:hypothetical protein [Nocardioides sp. URHA0032]